MAEYGVFTCGVQGPKSKSPSELNYAAVAMYGTDGFVPDNNVFQ